MACAYAMSMHAHVACVCLWSAIVPATATRLFGRECAIACMSCWFSLLSPLLIRLGVMRRFRGLVLLLLQ